MVKWIEKRQIDWEKSDRFYLKSVCLIWLKVLYREKQQSQRHREPGVLYCRKAAGKKLRKAVGFSRRDVVQIHQDASRLTAVTGALLFLVQPAPLRVEICALLLEWKNQERQSPSCSCPSQTPSIQEIMCGFCSFSGLHLRIHIFIPTPSLFPI